MSFLGVAGCSLAKLPANSGTDSWCAARKTPQCFCCEYLRLTPELRGAESVRFWFPLNE
jgi:hypothetical protein